MMGYWNNPEATAKTIDPEGWLRTGDRARIEDGHVYITGGIKEIIVMANGEKVPPGDMELAIATDGLFSQAEGLGSLESEKDGERLERILVERIAFKLKTFPGYAKIPRVAVIGQPWTIDAGLMTPTLKLKREKILEAQGADIDRLYAKR